MDLGDVQNQPNNVRAQRNRRPNWSPEQTTLMLDLIRQEQLNFRVAGPGTFNKSFWERISTFLTVQSAPPRDYAEVYRRWRTVKQDFHEFKCCKEKTGWNLHPDTHVILAPIGAWEELREKNSKLYKCKDKPFIWYDIMNEICGTNVASGYRAFDTQRGAPIEDLVSRSDSSDDNDNRTATQELNDFSLREFRDNVGVDLNLSFGEYDQSFPMEYSSQPFLGTDVGGTSNTGSGPASGAASAASLGKRAREGSQEKASSGKKSKGGSSGKSKDIDCNPIDLIVEESRERRNVFYEMKDMMKELLVSDNKKQVASKLIEVKKQKELSMREVLILQDALKDELNKEVFLTLDGVDLQQWIVGSIQKYESGK